MSYRDEERTIPWKGIGIGVSSFLFLLILLFCVHRVNVQNGEEAVLISHPVFFGHGGISNTPVSSGSVWVARTTTGIVVDMFPRTFNEEFKDIMPKDNNPVEYHAAVRLRVTDSVKMAINFGVDYIGELPRWYVNNVQRPFQTMNRNQVRQYSMPDLALQQSVVIDVEKALKTELQEYVNKLHLPLEVQDVTLGRISPAQEIIAAYNETGVQQQRAKTEHQRALAEDARKEAENKRALADQAYMQGLGLNPDQYIRLQTIKMCAEKPTCTVILGSTPVPTINAGK